MHEPYEPLPRIAHHLASRATRISDMAEGLFWAIDEAGLRLPPRRDIARRAHVSEATISRRFRESRSDETNLVSRLLDARRRTHPRGYASEGWARWLPDDRASLKDVRVWMSCLALAAYSAPLAEVVREVWDAEHESLVWTLTFDAGVSRDDMSYDVEAAADLLQVALLGVATRQALDPELSHEHALAMIQHLADLLARA